MLIAVEALIGAGKTTLCKALEDHTGVRAFYEPVDTNPFLNLYYAEPSRWALSMQLFLMQERIRMFKCAQAFNLNGDDCIMDRSYYGDFAFAEVQNADGYFRKCEYDTYIKWHELYQPDLIYPDLLLWLELSPSEAIERIKQRGRGCESEISLEYLTKLYDAYKRTLDVLSKRVEIVSIDARKDAFGVLADAECAIDNRRRALRAAGHPCYK